MTTSLFAAWVLAAAAAAAQDLPTASYRVELVQTAPPRLAVQATLPGGGDRLDMAPSRSADVPEIADAGWPGLVRGLSVADADGHPVKVTLAGATGWRLARPVDGPLTVRYEVDLAPLAQRGWPAPRETAFADDERLVLIGRALFLTTPSQGASEVRCSLPAGWQPVLPWEAPSAENGAVTVGSTEDLTENLLAFVQGRPQVLDAGGFRLKLVPFGPWQAAQDEVRRVLGATLRQLVALVDFRGGADYVVVLLPQPEDGGESFRASFAMNSEEPPTRDNVGRWGNLITHEVFHFWNGWRLRGADYASTQWFQEGFTEYVANRALVASGLIGEAGFRNKLAAHVGNSRRLTTPLDAPGMSKGPPLYSAGALVALTWDATIRERSEGERGLGDLLRELLRRTEDGARPYEWSDLLAALESVAPGVGWAEFHARFIHGTEPLPLAETVARLGLTLVQDEDGAVRIELDPAAPESAAALRHAIMGVER